MRAFNAFLVLSLTLVLAGRGHALDGTLEINEACAATGCFAGDAAGYPVTISTSGSYQLTGNLLLPAGTHGIEITGVSVVLDLNGFTVRGQGGTAAFDCIRSSGAGVRTVDVHDGQVASCQNDGIALSASRSATVRNLRVTDCRRHGLSFQALESAVEGSASHFNGGAGVTSVSTLSVSGTSSRFNQMGGIAAETATIVNSVASNNDGNGITCSGTCLVDATRAEFNQLDGVELTGEIGRALVVDSVLAINGGAQLDFGANLSAAYGRNMIRAAPTQSTVTGGVELGSNLCNGNTTCP